MDTQEKTQNPNTDLARALTFYELTLLLQMAAKHLSPTPEKNSRQFKPHKKKPQRPSKSTLQLS